MAVFAAIFWYESRAVLIYIIVAYGGILFAVLGLFYFGILSFLSIPFIINNNIKVKILSLLYERVESVTKKMD